MKKYSLSFLLAFVAVLVALSFTSTEPVLAQSNDTLTAVRVAEGTLDPFADVWAEAPALNVPLSLGVDISMLPVIAGYQYGPVTEVMMKAVYTDEKIYVLSVWADDTMNVDRRAWTFDGETWSRNSMGEDRISFFFDITGNRQFNALGCAAACHTGEADRPDYMGYPPDSMDAVDMWHWKAGRTGPAGYADDQWAGAWVNEEDGGRASDARESGGYSDNMNEAGDGPAFVYPEGATPGSPLLREFAVPFDAAMEFPAGYTVPFYVITRPVGSRGDIGAYSIFTKDNDGKGWWYVVQERALNTGNPEDTVLNLNSSNTFGVAIFNNTGDANHTVSEKLTLVIGG